LFENFQAKLGYRRVRISQSVRGLARRQLVVIKEKMQLPIFYDPHLPPPT